MTDHPLDAATPDARRRELIGAAAASAGAMLYGSSYVATAFVLRSFTPLSVALWRGAAGALLMAVYLVAARAGSRARSGDGSGTASDGASRPGSTPAPASAGRRPLSRWSVFWRLAVLGQLGGACFIVALNIAVDLSGAAIASFVAGLYAVLAAVLAPIVLREPLRLAALAGFGVALAGTYLLAGYQPSGSSAGGIAAGLVAAITFGLYLVLSRRWSRPWRLSPPIVTFSALLSTAIVLLAVELVREPAAIVPASIRLDALAALVWLAAMVGVVATLLVLLSVRALPASRSSAFLLLNPPTATLLAWILLGESLNAGQLAGGALVLAGIALATVASSRRGTASARQPPRPTHRERADGA